MILSHRQMNNVLAESEERYSIVANHIGRIGPFVLEAFKEFDRSNNEHMLTGPKYCAAQSELQIQTTFVIGKK